MAVAERASEAPLSLGERAYRELRRRILDNALPAGTQLLEQELADRLGMSRTPVREAAIRLEQEGLVAVRPRHGITVLPLAPDDMREIYAILTELEASAARALAERGLSAEELGEFEAAVEAMEKALAADNLDAWAAADERFHKLLVLLTGNRRLAATVETLWDQAHRARLVTLRIRPRPLGSNADHRALVAALAAGDGEAAYRIHRRHRLESGRLLVGLIEHLGLTRL